jgi:hypothetical protein
MHKFILSDSRYIFTKIGLRLGLKQIEVKKAPHNAALEKAYFVSKKWKLDRVLFQISLRRILVFCYRSAAWPSNSTYQRKKSRVGSS